MENYITSDLFKKAAEGWKKFIESQKQTRLNYINKK